jgi:hypothetical protein
MRGREQLIAKRHTNYTDTSGIAASSINTSAFPACNILLIATSTPVAGMSPLIRTHLYIKTERQKDPNKVVGVGDCFNAVVLRSCHLDRVRILILSSYLSGRNGHVCREFDAAGLGGSRRRLVLVTFQRAGLLRTCLLVP